jgi:excisionase family DNA binding protein
MADYFQGSENMINHILEKSVTVLDEEILTTEEAAKKLRMSTNTLLNKYVHTGKLKATPTRKGYIFKLSDVVNFRK